MALTEQELVQLENRPKVLPFPGAENFKPNFIYPKDTIIFHDNHLWRARDNFRSNDNFNEANWEQVAINSVEWADIEGDTAELDTDFTFTGNNTFTKPLNTNNINANGQVTENGQRVYSPNNKPSFPDGYLVVDGETIEGRSTVDSPLKVVDGVFATLQDLAEAVNNETQERAAADQALQSQLDGIQAITLTGELLTRVINGTTEVEKILFDPSIVFIVDKTLISDSNGTIGVYKEDIDGATILVETITISPIAISEPTLLGNVTYFSNLPLTLNGAIAMGWNTPKLDDYARVLRDETNNGQTVEWYITAIDADGNIIWGNPVIINTSDYQAQTSAADAGKVLTGGAAAGTFGESIPIDTVPTENSNNLITSGAVFVKVPNVIGFTYVIDSDQKLADWANNVAGNDYTRILIRKGIWTLNKNLTGGTQYYPNYVISISDSRTEEIEGELGSQIVINNSNTAAATNIVALVRHNMNKECYIRNVNISLILTGPGPGSGICIGNCTNLTNCTVTNTVINTTNVDADFSTGIYNCTNLTNCTGTGAGARNGYGIYNCTNLTNCTGIGNGNHNGYGIYNCTDLTNCTGTGTSKGIGSGNHNAYGFYNCTNLTNCTGTGNGNHNGYGIYNCIRLYVCKGKGNGISPSYGFFQCRTGFGCTNNGTSTTATFYNCLMSQDPNSVPSYNDWANSAAGGWNLP